MQVSSALPFTFYRNGVASFNQKQEPGIDKVCFFQPWNCEDEIKLQVLGDADEDQELRLAILDNGVEVESLEFTQTNNGSPGVPEAPITLPDVEDTYNTGTGHDWDDGVNPSIVMTEEDSPQSKIRAMDYDFIEGNEYEITVDLVYENASSSGNIYLYILDDDNNIVETEVLPYDTGDTTGTFTFTLSFTAGAGYSKIGVRIESEGAGSYTFIGSLDDITGTVTVPETPATYYLNSIEFTLSDLDLCNKYLTFEVREVVSDDLGFYTDPIDVKTLHRNTRLIYYTNNRNFAGIVYDDNEPVFAYRVLSKFFEPRFQQEDESEPDAEGNIDKLSGTVKEQKLLEVELLPPPELRKLTLIFKHNSVWIENEAWVGEEPFEIDKLEDRAGLFNGSIWLTKKDQNFYSNVG